MGFFAIQSGPTGSNSKQYSTELLQQLKCKGCPLNHADNVNPYMDPIGPDDANVYLLGDSPSSGDDKKGMPFVGKAGQIIRQTLGKQIFNDCRTHNTIRCKVPEDREAKREELESCRPYIEQDIEYVKPKVIIGFGGVPLKWMTGETNSKITNWRGRWMPVKIGEHYCWYYAVYDPEFVMRNWRYNKFKKQYQRSIFDDVFERDLAACFDALEDGLSDPETYFEDPEDIYENVEIFEGTGIAELEIDQIANLFEWAKTQPAVAVDIETNGLRPYKDDSRIITVSFGVYGYSFAYPLDHPRSNFTESQIEKLHKLTKDFLLDTGPVKVAHNLSMEQEWFAKYYGTEVLRTGKWGDTMAQAYTLDERRGMLGLEALIHQKFGFPLKQVSNMDRSRLEEYKTDEVLYYNALDVKYTHALYRYQKKEIKKEGKNLKNAYDEQIRRIPTMVLTQMKGLNIDFNKNLELTEYLNEQYNEVYSEIQNLDVVKRYNYRRENKYNPHSTPETLKIFRDYLDRPEVYTQDNKGNTKESVDEGVLSTINHRLSSLILQIRNIHNLRTKYVYPLNEYDGVYVHDDKKAHPNLNTTFTATGRLSSDDPPSQQFPKRRDKYVRRQIAPPENHWMVAIDFGQLEARVAAMLSGDETLISYIWNGYDIHQAWAEWFAEADPKLVGGSDYVNDPKALKKLRDVIKNGWVFPIIYGAKARTLAHYMNVSNELAEEAYAIFWDRHPGIWQWQKKQLRTYEKYGYIEMITGRRRHQPMDINKILNSEIQGVSSDIVVDAMNRLSEIAEETGDWKFQPCLNVHDDISFFIPDVTFEDDLEVALNEILIPSYDWAKVVPLTVEVEAGPNWADMVEIGEFSNEEDIRG